MKAKAIETNYRGLRFRSRLEARWAVFFDTLGIPFEYEVEGFELPTGRYLPDFWMPRQDCWIEIKGKQASEREQSLASELAVATDKEVFIFQGQIHFPRSDHGLRDGDFSTAEVFFPNGSGDCHYMWCCCHQCGKYELQFDGRTSRMKCKATGCEYLNGDDNKGYNWHGGNIPMAARKAATARFEFDERK